MSPATRTIFRHLEDLPESRMEVTYQEMRAFVAARSEHPIEWLHTFILQHPDDPAVTELCRRLREGESLSDDNPVVESKT